jgi:two-component system, chemotaxis family, chemotaxis protein CheY
MSKLRILVVDDDNLMRELLKAILRHEGYVVVGEAKDGPTALAACEKLRPEVVCLDVNMPGMSGIEVLKLLRASYADTRVVMITGDASLSTVRDAVSLGAAGFIIKPFTAARVADVLNAALKPASIFQ